MNFNNITAGIEKAGAGDAELSPSDEDLTPDGSGPDHGEDAPVKFIDYLVDHPRELSLAERFDGHAEAHV